MKESVRFMCMEHTDPKHKDMSFVKDVMVYLERQNNGDYEEELRIYCCKNKEDPE